jgi:Arm DNA-binding domain
MPRVSLTDRFVASARTIGDDPQTDFFDAVTTGLVLRVSDTAKSWNFSFSLPDRKRARMTLGTYPAMPLSVARTKAIDVKDCTDKIMRRGSRTQAWHTHKNIRAALNWAVANDFIPHNPIAQVEAPGGFNVCERTLSDDEIYKLWHGLCATSTTSLLRPSVSNQASRQAA